MPIANNAEYSQPTMPVETLTKNESESQTPDLAKHFPKCFNLNSPRPLKIGIHFDIRAELEAQGYSFRKIRQAVTYYCQRPAYMKTLVVGAERIDHRGEPAGTITEKEVEIAKAQIKVLWKKYKARKAARAALNGEKKTRPQKSVKKALLEDAPLTEENIVSGRLELTVKFSEIPDPLPVTGGVKIGLPTQDALVVATLSSKSWKKITKAQGEWSEWRAVLTGQLGTKAVANDQALLVLENPGLQVFESRPR
ncbi:ProQ/FinO family protein [Allochromatium humboldtianum]|uniref:ProQ/FinO family protein n=1 Tax=Allochromatium humboldtianum TaxID=504901 RepID=A0A850RJ89_9GAMM|nr:ProQ/FinO family protein [Allochromatium humboldtianum]NVZ11567.1 ProQ/FinO family protein [Allochromatium humboldtianum]